MPEKNEDKEAPTISDSSRRLPDKAKKVLDNLAGAGSVLALPLGVLFWAFTPKDTLEAWKIVVGFVVVGLPGYFIARWIQGLQDQIRSLKHDRALDQIRFEETERNLARQLSDENGQAQDTLREHFELLLTQKEAAIKEALDSASSHKKALDDEMQHRIKSRLDHLAALHGMIHRVRDICHSRPRSEIKTIHDALTIFEKISNSILTDTRTLFLTYFRSIGIDMGEDVAVTLKLRVSRQMLLKAGMYQAEELNHLLGASDYGLITVARDGITAHIRRDLREVLGTIYSVEANSAFRHILNESWNGRAMFAENDLLKRKAEEGYENQNANWHKFYNSTIAVAVRYWSDENEKSERYGFLCIDSLNPNKHNLYEHDESFHIASHAADLLALILYGMGLQHRPAKK